MPSPLAELLAQDETTLYHIYPQKHQNY